MGHPEDPTGISLLRGCGPRNRELYLRPTMVNRLRTTGILSRWGSRVPMDPCFLRREAPKAALTGPDAVQLMKVTARVGGMGMSEREKQLRQASST